MKTEEIEQALTAAGLDAEKAKALASKIAPQAPTRTDVELKQNQIAELRSELRALPVQLGLYAPDSEKLRMAHAKEVLVKKILELQGHAPLTGVV